MLVFTFFGYITEVERLKMKNTRSKGDEQRKCKVKGDGQRDELKQK
jgi:hypothetical protein